MENSIAIKPMCTIDNLRPEHIVIRVFNTIKTNDNLELAREFYRKSLYYRTNKKYSGSESSYIMELAQEYVTFL